MTDLPLINIITRTGNRKQCFKNLKESLKTQTYQNFVHYKTNDNPQCSFLKGESNVIEVWKKVRKRGMCPYNLYLNVVIEMLRDGWVLIVDDDAKFVNDNFLLELAKKCKEKRQNEVLIIRSFLGKSQHHFPLNHSYDMGTIDMSNICIHYSLLQKFLFSNRCRGDFLLIRRLLRENYTLCIDKTIPVGIWANYCGAKAGKNIDCDAIQ